MSILPNRPGDDNQKGQSPPNDRGNPGPFDTLQDLPAGAQPLIFEVNGTRFEIDTSLLETPATAERLRAVLQAIDEGGVVDFSNLLKWSHEARWPALNLAAMCNWNWTFRDTAGGEHALLLDAILTSMVGADDVTGCERGVRAAAEVAGLVNPDALRPACNRVLDRLRQLGVKGYRISHILKLAEAAAKAASGTVAVNEESASVLVREVLPDATVGEDVVVPSGWVLSRAGVSRAGEDGPAETAIPSPVVIVGRHVEQVSGEMFLTVAWLRDARWTSHTVSRGKLADSRGVLELANRGAPVNSNNAREVVAYLADFEVANEAVLLPTKLSRQLGWQGDEAASSFLWGRTLLAADGVEDEAGAEPRTLVFRGADDGDDQRAAAFHSHGTPEGWADAIEPAGAFDRARLAVYSALATVLLRIVSAPNFIVSFAGATSQGKTITLRVAASIWGSPDDQGGASVLATWDATRVWTERAAAVGTDLPLILDDTKRARRREDTAQVTYDVAAGQGRNRGSIEGMRSSMSFRTVMLSSGEESLMSYTQDGGTRARVLELWGSPFGATDAATAQLVNGVNEGLLDNYGHAGPAFVRFLLAHRNRWPAWREHFRRLRRRYERRAGNNSVAARIASHLAVIRITAVLAHRAGLLPWGYRDVTRLLWTELTAETPEADRAAAALRHVMSWASGHVEEFYWPERHGFGNDGPAHVRDIAGRWNLDSRTVEPGDRYVGFLPHKLDAVLAEGGFQADAIVRQWADRGWLLTSPGRGRRYRARLGTAGATDLVAISAAAIEEVCGPLESPGRSRLSPLEGQAVAAARRPRFQPWNGNGTGTGTP